MFGKYDDPWMINMQPGFEYKTTLDRGNITVKSALAYLGLRNTADQANSAILNSKGAISGNTTNDDGTLKYQYEVIYPSISFEYAWGGMKNKTKAFADYIYNPDHEGTGFLLEAKIGYKNVGKKFDVWQLSYNYRYLEDDAFLAAFSDSDAHSGVTNVKGSEISLTMGLCKNVLLGLDYYYMEPISGSNRQTESFFQTDLVFKF